MILHVGLGSLNYLWRFHCFCLKKTGKTRRFQQAICTQFNRRNKGDGYMTEQKLTHLDAAGRAKMVDVTAKGETTRIAVARGEISMAPETLALIKDGHIAKGDVLAVAQVAGVMGAKRTPDVIPMCHPLLLTGVAMDFRFDEENSSVLIQATTKLSGKTGVEMEALTAVSIAALTIYDMCKAVDKRMKISNIRLVEKQGGKSGLFQREEEKPWEKL